MDATVNNANNLYILASRKDEEISSLMERLLEKTAILQSDEAPIKEKHRAIVSAEYLFVRLRLLVEFEHINIKNILNSLDTSLASLRPFFTKRDVYLAQVCQKLTTIQNDMSVLQKLTYNTSVSQI